MENWSMKKHITTFYYIEVLAIHFCNVKYCFIKITKNHAYVNKKKKVFIVIMCNTRKLQWQSFKVCLQLSVHRGLKSLVLSYQ